MKVYIVSHKNFEFPQVIGYCPMQVGYDKDLFELRDNCGYNIASKNSSFCELTAAYWIMKNEDDNIVGLVHYRRYFFDKFFSKSYTNILTEKKIEKLLRNYDILVPKKLYLYNESIYEQYKNNYNIEDYEECRNIIKEMYPSYLEIFDEVSSKHELIPCNMMITRKELFDEYHEWLFSILFELEKRIDISNYDSHNKRVFGFISERLFTMWLKHNNYKVKYCTVHNIESKNFLMSYLKNNVRGIVLKMKGGI